MEIINVYEKSMNNWTIRPGPVGSVGDVNMQVRLKGNMPDSSIRYDKDSSGANEKFYGSNVQDGSYGSGATARVNDMKFGSRPGHKTSVGWMVQNIIPEDRSSTSVMSALGKYSWDNKRATVMRAKVTGENFLPAAGVYDQSLLTQTQSLSRGNQVPRVVLTESGSEALPNASGSFTKVAEGQNIITNPYKQSPSVTPALGQNNGGPLRPTPGRKSLF